MYQVPVTVAFVPLSVCSALLAVRRHCIRYVRAGLGSEMAFPKHWRNVNHSGFFSHLTWRLHREFMLCWTASWSQRQASHRRIGSLPGFLKGKCQSAVGTLHWLHLLFSWLRTLHSPSCFSGIGIVECYCPPVLFTQCRALQGCLAFWHLWATLEEQELSWATR